MWLLRLLCVIALGVFGRCTNEGRVVRTQVFYHIYAAGDWSIVVNDQLTKIAFTGLYKTVQAINCFIVADNQTDLDKATVLLSSWGGKFIIRDSILKDPTYERFTLMKMKPLINPHDRILYIHSKGVSHHDEMAPNIYWWRNYMEFFLRKEYKLCIRLLEQYDTVGVNFRGDHYSGNFWWARGDYYLTLPNHIEKDYLALERFLLKDHNDSSRYSACGNQALITIVMPINRDTS